MIPWLYPTDQVRHGLPELRRSQHGGEQVLRRLRQPLPSRCTACGAENPPGKKFCADCGAALVIRASAAPGEAASPLPTALISSAERRQLTVLFCDLVGSTALASRLDPEDLREIIGAYHRGVAEAVARCDGFVANYMGDGVLVYFGYPQAHEDDAEQAVRAGLALVDAVGRLQASGCR